MESPNKPLVVPKADWTIALAEMIKTAPDAATIWVRSDAMKEMAIRAAQRLERQDLHFEILREGRDG